MDHLAGLCLVLSSRSAMLGRHLLRALRRSLNVVRNPLRRRAILLYGRSDSHRGLVDRDDGGSDLLADDNRFPCRTLHLRDLQRLFSVALAVSVARSVTSEVTAAKALLASPGRAALMVELSPCRFV